MSAESITAGTGLEFWDVTTEDTDKEMRFNRPWSLSNKIHWAPFER